MDWSTDGQTPEFLAATRMASLGDDVVATIHSKLDVKPGMRILDVGCGSGEYCFRLGSAVEGVEFIGLEYDPSFVAFANARASGEIEYPFEPPNPANAYRFVQGDGLDLPFEDGTFDMVVSHTYLTALPDWACALAEMCRACKPGGVVSSVTSMTDDFYGTGTIELFSNLVDPAYAEVLRGVEEAKAEAFPTMNLTSGILPRKVPVAFDWIGLGDVRCTPLAHYFCLSDAGVDEPSKQRYVDLLYAMERNNLARLMGHPTARSMLNDEQWAMYEALIEARRDQLRQTSANHEWNWYGNASLLVCGTVPDEGPDERWRAMREEARRAGRALDDLACACGPVDATSKQLDYGRCIRTRLVCEDGLHIEACGFDPPRALLESCGKLAAKTRESGDALPDSLHGLAELEQRCTRAEAQFGARSSDGIAKLANGEVYAIPDMWETVSEAALAGVRVSFEDSGIIDGCVVVGCIAQTNDGEARAIAAHPDFQEAVRRAFARAIGSLQKFA